MVVDPPAFPDQRLQIGAAPARQVAQAGRGGMMRAPHTLEIPFVFDNVERGPLLPGTAPATRALAKQTSTAWTAFARTGDPNARGSGLPTWPRYEATKRSTMMFNTRSRIENDPYAVFRKLMPPRGF